MARPPGSRNSGYDVRRRALARRVLDRMAQPTGSGASMRELAAAAGVSVPTLRHYFQTREGALQAAMAQMRELGAPWLQVAAHAEVDQPLADSLRWFFTMFLRGWEGGLGAMLGESLAAATGVTALGVTAIEEVLEPTVQALETRLAHHQQAGMLDPEADLRHAALALFSPALIALLHQHTWSGAQCRPLDIAAFLDAHVARFVAGWKGPRA